jgi:hypothetical protein
MTLDFGGTNLPFDLGFELLASVADTTGAVGWDWQMTPQSK